MLYVHIPFCTRKCLYCDFYSVGSRLADWPRFADSLLAEARLRRDEIERASSPLTLYIGGGTPSLIPAEIFMRLADELQEICGPVEEFTIEVNPDDVNAEKIDAWKKAGVNRISMGVQSLADAELKAVGRRHDAVCARRAYDLLAKDFDNISLDLMFGLPYQSIDSLRATLQGFLEMKPQHISAYSLMYEERTALTLMRDKGEIEETDEQDSTEMFTLINDTLAAGGYEQYEISNYALPGKRSIHNSAYWHGNAYVGLGPGAHSYDGARLRRANLPELKSYMKGEFLHEMETLTDEELTEEYIMTRMRTREGISYADFSCRFGDGACRELRSQAKRLAKQDLVSSSADCLQLTRRGIMISDLIISSLFV